MSGNACGALWMLASGLTYSLAIALVKLLGDSYSSATQNFVRQTVGLVILLPLILRDPRGALMLRRPMLMFLRCASTSLSIILAFNSFHLLGLAEANALSFTRALFLVPLAALILGEGIDRHRILATIVGFLGVLVILAPNAAHSMPLWPAAQGLLAALLVAWSVIGVKSMTRDHSSLALLTWSVILGVVFTAPFAWSTWTTPTAKDLMLLVVMGVLGVVNQACYIRGMAVGEASLMAPLDYARIIFTAAIGYVMFRELPLFNTYIGSAIIMGSAVYVTLHGRRREAAATAVPAV